MIPAVLSALRGSHPHRCPPGIVWLLGALALAILAGCGGSSSNCGGGGGGGGYQIDGAPGLLSCGSTSSAGGTTDVTMPAMIAQNTAFNSDANAYGVVYPMPGTAGTLPAAGTSPTLTLTGPAHPQVNPNPTDYTLTASPAVTSSTLNCEIATGGLVFVDSTYGAWTGTTATLGVNYPAFTGSGSFTINCVGVNAGGNTTLASLTVMVP